jgi:hypothetical protein
LTVGKTNDEPIVVRTIEAINVDDQSIDTRVFADNAINPTVETIVKGEDLTSFVDNGDAATTDDSNDSGADITPPPTDGTEGDTSLEGASDGTEGATNTETDGV